MREHFLPPLLEAILIDYQRNVPGAREPEVLSTVTTIVDKLEASVFKICCPNITNCYSSTCKYMYMCNRILHESITNWMHHCVIIHSPSHSICPPSSPSSPPQGQAVPDIPTIIEALFECTLEMLNKDLEEFPEHRHHFFRMLQSFTIHCFQGG